MHSERRSSFKMETTERDNYLNLCAVGGYEWSIRVLYSHRFVSFLCCMPCVCVVVAVALSRLLCATDLFSCRSLLSHYLQLRSTRCAYAFVLVSMPRQTKIKPFEIYVAVFCALSVHLALRGSWIPTQISFKHNIVWLVHSSVGFNNSIETYGMRDGKMFLSASLFARFS